MPNITSGRWHLEYWKQGNLIALYLLLCLCFIYNVMTNSDLIIKLVKIFSTSITELKKVKITLSWCNHGNCKAHQNLKIQAFLDKIKWSAIWYESFIGITYSYRLKTISYNQSKRFYFLLNRNCPGTLLFSDKPVEPHPMSVSHLPSKPL